MRMIHELKCVPPYFEAVAEGRKTFEVRRNDRRFWFADTLWLREYNPSGVDKALERNPYTGRECRATITYVLDSPEYCKDGFVILGLRLDSLDSSPEDGK